MTKVIVRPANEKDVAFIFSSWLKSYRKSFFAKNIHNEIYYAQHHNLVEDLLRRCTVLVACSPEDRDTVYGYVVSEKLEDIPVIHYCYVKHTFRNYGIGRALVREVLLDLEASCFYTHHTKVVESVSSKLNLVYNPYLCFQKAERSKEELINEDKAE